MRKIILLTIMLFCCVRWTFAQKSAGDEYPKIEIFAGYSASGYVEEEIEPTVAAQRISPFFNDEAGGNLGFEISVIRNFNKHIGIKGDFSMYFNNKSGSGTFQNCTPAGCTTSVQGFRVKTRAPYFMIGPEIKARNRTRLTPFAHALFGLVYSRAIFSTASPTFSFTDKDSQTGFSMAFGGGLDIRVSKRVGIRTMMDYNATFLRGSDIDSRSRQDHVRLSLGLLFH